MGSDNQSHLPAICPSRKSQVSYRVGGWVGPVAELDEYGRGNVSLTPELEPPTVQPVPATICRPQYLQYYCLKLECNFLHLTTNSMFVIDHHYHHHHHHHISVMELGHLLTRSGFTYPEVSSEVCHDSFCQLGNNVSLFWVIYYEAFRDR
jgi:hypothetical protein